MSLLKRHSSSCLIQPLVTDSMIQDSIPFAERMFTEEKTKYYQTEDQKVKCLIPKPKKPIKKLNHSVQLKNELKNQIKEIKMFNKSLNEKLDNILKEDDRIIEQRNSRKTSGSFDFNPFAVTQSSKHSHENDLIPLPILKNKVISFSPLKNYDDIIRNKVSNETNAKNQIINLKALLKEKNEKYVQINKRVQELFSTCNENKISFSRSIDSNVIKMQEIKLLQRNSIVELAHKQNALNLIVEANQKTFQINNNIKTIYKNLNYTDEYYKKEINNYINELKDLHIEIKHIQNSLNESIKQCINYYLEILSSGIDTRNEGFSWIIKRLIELDYEVKPTDFPPFFDITKIEFVVKISNLQLAQSKLIEQLKELKEKILVKRNEMIKSKSQQRIIQRDFKKKRNTQIIQAQTMMNRINTNDPYPYKKVYGLIEKYKYQYVSPDQEGRIKKCLLFANVHKYKACESQLICNPMIPRTHSAYGIRNDKKISQISFDNKSEENKEQLKLLKKIITIKQNIKLNDEKISSLSKGEIKAFKEKYKNKMYIHDNINKLSSALFGNRLLQAIN